jgi:hypothetical protein
MLIQTTITCPMCEKEVDSLQYWATGTATHYHLCKDCLVKEKYMNDYLDIGYAKGYEEAMEKIREYINKQLE